MTATSKSGPVHVSEVLGDLIHEWHEARQSLRAIEEAERPDLIDALGRTWRWLDGELYTHDRMAWTKHMVLAAGITRPSQHALDNPNYTWCAICKGGSA